MARGRQPSPIRRIERKIQIPEVLDAEVQLMLFSPLEQRVPYGALSGLIVPLLERFMVEYREKVKMVEVPKVEVSTVRGLVSSILRELDEGKVEDARAILERMYKTLTELQGGKAGD